MSTESLRRRIGEQAQNRCGYCQTQERVSGIPLTLEHIIPRALGGLDAEENLWVSCRLCNEAKGIQVEAVDPHTGKRAPLFNPRVDQWLEHFRWSEDSTKIIGLTDRGRATVDALSLNTEFRMRSRAIWVEAGFHPPD